MEKNAYLVVFIDLEISQPVMMIMVPKSQAVQKVLDKQPVNDKQFKIIWSKNSNKGSGFNYYNAN